MDLELPKSKDSMGGLKAILTNLEILLFLVTANEMIEYILKC